MQIKNPTLSEFVMLHQPEMLPVFVQLENSAKIIASNLRVTNLKGMTGLSGKTNGYGEKVQKLDDFANELLVEKMLASQQVAIVLSEELKTPIYGPDQNSKFIFTTDPIDGSSNIDIALPVGTIFSFYPNKLNIDNNYLQKGRDQIACGYILYSNSTSILLTFGYGVYLFTLDNEADCFFLTGSNVQIPETQSTYSINEGNYHKYFDQTKRYLAKAKDKGYKLRYIGSMVPDIHRTILNGGLFAYPADSHLPNGKLRLLYEINPMSMLVEQAGGISRLEDGQNPLDIMPTSHDQTAGIVIGSKAQVNEYLDCR